MFPDSKTTIDSNSTSRGRDSNRIFSNWAFDESVIILDLEHMPHGCATWPAFWSYSQMSAWPTGGEIDIIEVTHTPVSTPNFSTLRTRTSGRQPSYTKLDFVAYAPKLCNARGAASNWVNELPTSHLMELVAHRSAGRLTRQIATLASTTTKAAELRFSSQIPTVKISTRKGVDSMPWHAARKTVSKFGSGPGTVVCRMTWDTMVILWTQICGVLLRPTFRPE